MPLAQYRTVNHIAPMRLNHNVLGAHWHIIQGKLEREYDELSEEDLELEEGHEEEMIDHLSQRLGIDREEMIEEMELVLGRPLVDSQN